MVEILVIFAGLIGAITTLPQAWQMWHGRNLDAAAAKLMLVGFCSDLVWTFYSLKILSPLLIFVFFTATLFRGLILILARAQSVTSALQVDLPVAAQVAGTSSSKLGKNPES